MVVLTPALKTLQAASKAKAATEQEHAEARQLALGASASPSDREEVLSMVARMREAEPWPAMEQGLRMKSRVGIALGSMATRP